MGFSRSDAALREELKLEAARVEAGRAKAPRAVEFAARCADLAAELNGSVSREVRERIEAIGWQADELASKGIEISEAEVREALDHIAGLS